jgi:ABC-type phosphate transport system substrate-binding protein
VTGRSGRRVLRTVLGAVVCGLAAVVVTSVAWGAPTPTPLVARQPVTLQGAGSSAADAEITDWKNAMYGAKSSVGVQYTAAGTVAGRDDFLRGDDDFVLSGVPFTADELKRLKNGAGDLVAAPVFVTADAFMFAPPLSNVGPGLFQFKQVCNPDDPSTWPPGQVNPDDCNKFVRISGSLAIPKRNFSSMLYHVDLGGGAVPTNAWNNTDVLKSLGLPGCDTAPQQPPCVINTSLLSSVPTIVTRGDPDETMQYLQQYVKTATPDVWEQLSNGKWDPITEEIAFQCCAFRRGAELVAQQLELGGADPVTGSLSTGGTIAALPPSYYKTLNDQYPKSPVQYIEIQNASGQWTIPTVDAIDKAIDAGGSTPLYALTNKVDGAYPLVWPVYLYTRAHGLSPDKAEAIATFVRYLATDAQNGTAKYGDGRLSGQLQAQAFAAADKIVTENCTQAGYAVVDSIDPGPYAPKGSNWSAIGSMKHCQPAAPVTTTVPTTSAPTTVAPATTPSLTGDTTPSVSGGGSGDTTSTTVASTSNPASTTSSANTKHQAHLIALTASKLPLPPPSAAGTTDKLAAFVLGALLYLLLRKPIGRAVGAARS